MTQPGAPPPQPLGMSDFFALEAGEYLDRLDALLQPPAPPAAEELVRLARALRENLRRRKEQARTREPSAGGRRCKPAAGDEPPA